MPIKLVFVDGMVIKSWYPEPKEDEIEKTWSPQARQAAAAAHKGGGRMAGKAPGMTLGQKVKRVGMAAGGALLGGAVGSSLGGAIGGTAGGLHGYSQNRKDYQQVLGRAKDNWLPPKASENIARHMAGSETGATLRGTFHGIQAGQALGGLAGAVAGARAGWKKGTPGEVQPKMKMKKSKAKGSK